MNISVTRPAATQPPFFKRARTRRLPPVLAAAALLYFGAAAGHAQIPEARVPLPLTHIAPAHASARLLARTDSAKPLTLTLVLPLRNRAGLEAQIHRLYDPRDPLYGHFLTPEQFDALYGPSQADIDAVTAFAEAHGLTVDEAAPGSTLVHVSGPASSVETAFGVHLNDYRSADGRTFFAADREPTASPLVASRLLSVLGLTNNQRPHAFSRRASVSPDLAPLLTYYNGNQGLDPADIKSIYGLTGTTFTGTGQVAGLFELGTYAASDIQTYFTTYGVKTPVNPISVDGYNTGSTPGQFSDEVTLDIDMFAALAPGLSQIRVYEEDDQSAASFSQLLVDSFTQMSNETAANRPSVISVSYGDTEDDYAAADFQALDQATAKLASQGQTVCVAAGDSGAYTNQSQGASQAPNASFPATDPYVLCVGGTDLTDGLDANSNCTYLSESSWSDTSDNSRGPIGTGGGGGTSSYFPLPTYQKNAFTTSANPQGSSTKRNVPDVSLYGDYDTGGYDVYLSGWAGYNGTSAASPLWAAFLADVNQARAAKSQGAIGFSNPSLYTAAESSSSSTLFHDIADGSNNLYYNAVKGYDNSTGWGSFLGSNLLTALSASAAPPANQVRFYPRSAFPARMVGGLFQGSHDNSAWTTLATVTATPPATAYTTLPTSADPATFRYLRYLAPNSSFGDVAEIEFDSNNVKLTGTGFGTAGSYKNNGTTFSKALDGSTSTYFDAPAPGNGDYVGIDRGASGPNQVRFYPRSAFPARMVGGLFQGSHDNSAWTTLATVTQTPPATAYTTLPTSADPATFRYLRYLAPNSSFGDVAEIEFDSNGVKLTGTGFGTAGSYKNNGTTFSNALDGNTGTYFDAPAPGSGDYVGIDQGAPAPTLTSFSPASGPVGTSVIINGTNFTGLTAVKFGGVACTTFAANSATQIQAIVPTGAVTGAISVTTTSGTATSTASYTVTASAAALSSLAYNPNPAYSSGLSQGTITLTGQAPAGGASVAITNNGSTLTTVVIAAGQTSGTYEQPLNAVTSSTNYTLTAVYNSGQVSATLTANPTSVTLSSFSLTPNPVASGGTFTGTVTLSAAAPAGGAAVTIFQGTTNLGYVAIAAGAVTVNFPLTAPTESSPTTVPYSAAYNNATKAANETVN